MGKRILFFEVAQRFERSIQCCTTFRFLHGYEDPYSYAIPTQQTFARRRA